MLYPALALRDCGHCLEHLYDLETGYATTQTRTGQFVKRAKNDPAACRTPRGCPKGTAENQVSLSRKNERAYRFHLKCEALGSFPDDGIVRRNAGFIAMAREQAGMQLEWRQQNHNRIMAELLSTAIKLRTI